MNIVTHDVGFCWTAIDLDTYAGEPSKTGWGNTPLEAINELQERLGPPMTADEAQAFIDARRMLDMKAPYTPLTWSGTAMHPICNVCGWRKGGVDSWDGRRCKCGHAEPYMIIDAALGGV